MCRTDPEKQCNQLGCAVGIMRTGDGGHLGQGGICGSGEKRLPFWVDQSDGRRGGAGTFVCPSSGISPPHFSTLLMAQGLIHTDCITSGFPLGLACVRLLQKIRRQDEHVRVLSSQRPPFLPCHHGLTVTVHLRLQLSPYSCPPWIPGNFSLPSLPPSHLGVMPAPAVASSRVHQYPFIGFPEPCSQLYK